MNLIPDSCTELRRLVAFSITGCFLLINIWVRCGVVTLVNPRMSLGIYLFACFLFCVVVFGRNYSVWALSLFAYTLPLYGAPGSLYVRVHVFEFLLSVLGLALLIVALQGSRDSGKNRIVYLFLSMYLLYSLFSLLLFPAREYIILSSFSFFPESWITMLFANNQTPLYALASLNRLGLYVCFVILLARQKQARKIFKAMFVALLLAGITSSLIGLAHVVDVPGLDFSVSAIHQQRLQSIFVHPNTLAMFLSLSIPFSFYVFFNGWGKRTKYVVFFMVAGIYASTLIFTLCRASWLVFPFALGLGTLVFAGKRYNILQSLQLFLQQGQRKNLVVLICLVMIPAGAFSMNFIVHHSAVSKRLSVGQPGAGVGMTAVKQRLGDIFRPTVRERIAHDTLYLLRESPIFGLGFGSYGWHTFVMSHIPQSLFSMHRREKKLWGSPHSLYLSHLVNGGIVGLVLWLSLIGWICCLIVADIRFKKSLESLPVLLCVISFHLYGLAESMCFTPVIWFIIFLCIGYAATINETVMPERMAGAMKSWAVLCGVMVLLGGLFYLGNFQSWRLAKKYGLQVYVDPDNVDQQYYTGFFSPVNSPIGRTRWMGKQGLITITNPGVMTFDVVCEHPDIEKDPVIVTLEVSGEILDRIVFTRRTIVRRQYFFPKSFVGQSLRFSVSRTWNPQSFGEKWARVQGVAVSTPLYSDVIPAQGIGLSVWEKITGSLPEWAHFGQRYRWTGHRATLRIDAGMRREGLRMFLRSRHPDLLKKPVRVDILAGEKRVGELVLSSDEWQTVFIEPMEMTRAGALTIKVDRTWNPFLSGVSQDTRELGVMLALP